MDCFGPTSSDELCLGEELKIQKLEEMLQIRIFLKMKNYKALKMSVLVLLA